MPEFRRYAALTVASVCVLTTLATLAAAHPVAIVDGRDSAGKSARATDSARGATSTGANETQRGRGEGESRFRPIVVMTPTVTPFNAQVDLVPNGVELPGGVAGACPPTISTWTNASFTGGSYVVQGGFAEQEMAGASFTIDPSFFPIKIDMAEMIFATSSAAVTTTTKWSIHFYEGTPATGQEIANFASDGKILPHLIMPPGTNGTNIQFSIDPGDPEQIVIQDDGSHTFSFAYRIDDHNNQTQSPCLVPPPTASNAFPTTDVGGLQNPTKNWLFAVNCGPFGCPAGWKSFNQLGLCTPSGDWVMRVTWSPFTCETQGACCLPNGDCDFLTQTQCQSQGGTYLGDDVPCGIGACSGATVACCFAATGGCLNLLPATCVAAGGVPGAIGSNCTGFVCFPTGACCLPSGSCIGPVSPETCAAQGGTFQGNNTSCATANCPQPTGACCFGTGFCLVLKEADCLLAGATWAGPGSNCSDGNGDGSADACQPSNPADLNNDGVVNAGDLAILLGAWGTTSGPADINGDGIVNASDLSILLGAWD
jgi:Dockerin type I domain